MYTDILLGATAESGRDQLKNYISELVKERMILGKFVYYILICLAVVFLIKAVNTWIKKIRESKYYVGICVATILAAICFILVMSTDDAGVSYRLRLLGIAGLIFIPVLLCRHISGQVSYRRMNWVFSALLYVVPCGLLLVIIREIYFPSVFVSIPLIKDTIWYTVIFLVYSTVALVRAFLFCFSVFFQMSPRMRVSTWLMLVSISSITLLLLTDQLITSDVLAFITQNQTMAVIVSSSVAISLIAIVLPLNLALSIMPPEDVIVTSREFVVEGLTTSILVLNRRDEILDWNKKNRTADDPIPVPIYREPFAVYKQRIMTDTDRFEFFSEDVIITSHDDREYYYLLHREEIRNKWMLFGYIIEISEITPIYSVLRSFEDVAYIDQLTSLYNRNSYINQVSHVVREEHMPLVVMVGDVNRLKYTNDLYGHLQGDALLIMVAGIIRKALPPGAYAARVGGDEFVLLIPNGSIEIAEMFIEQCDKLCQEADGELFGNPNISWGYDIMRSVDEVYNDVLTNADQMMYQNKRKHYAFRSSGLVPDSDFLAR